MRRNQAFDTATCCTLPTLPTTLENNAFHCPQGNNEGLHNGEYMKKHLFCNHPETWTAKFVSSGNGNPHVIAVIDVIAVIVMMIAVIAGFMK